ncbi:hypothetical protein mRhiFer1_009731 [Rhinolophus ferrumequinum]|uniref:Uncharacterized protein n=1 Tax=Rhinolophus ferrumequinum TaxID=59479 RepID=A0A7J7ZCL1_RHIFE|nr:hypothetical protein mRhiFer1_009731 [Rhinolophus ferrumequinum]
MCYVVVCDRIKWRTAEPVPGKCSVLLPPHSTPHRGVLINSPNKFPTLFSPCLGKWSDTGIVSGVKGRQTGLGVLRRERTYVYILQREVAPEQTKRREQNELRLYLFIYLSIYSFIHSFIHSFIQLLGSTVH